MFGGSPVCKAFVERFRPHRNRIFSGDTPQEEWWMMRRSSQMTKGKLLGSSEGVL